MRRVAAVLAVALLGVTGALTATSAARADTPVADLAALQSAFAAAGAIPSTVELTAPIASAWTELVLPANTVLELDLDGHALTLQSIRLEVGAALTITDSSSAGAAGLLTLAATNLKPGIRTSDANLRVDGRVQLNVTGGNYGAGIGGGLYGAGGTIEITEQARVTARPGIEGAAGIGGGVGGAAGAITIGGSAQVTAIGRSSGPGIGHGGFPNSGSGSILIKDSAVVNASSPDGAGIGDLYLAQGHSLTVTDDAQLTATGGWSYPGIGIKTVSITGNATVHAIGGYQENDPTPYQGAAIGGQHSGTQLSVAPSATLRLRSTLTAIDPSSLFGPVTIDGTLELDPGTELRVPVGAAITGGGTLTGAGSVQNLGAIALPEAKVLIPQSRVTGNDFRMLLDSNGGWGVPSSVRVLGPNFADAGRALPMPSRGDFTAFEGWTLASAPFTESSTITAPGTLVATWDRPELLLEYTLDGAAFSGGTAYRSQELGVVASGFTDWNGAEVEVLLDNTSAWTGTVASGGFTSALISIPNTAVAGEHEFAVNIDGQLAGLILFTIPAEVGAAAPLLSGPAAPDVGNTLTASWADWPAGTVFDYQWLRNGAAISGATSASYKAVAADRGKRLSVRVTGTHTAYGYQREATSAQTRIVGAGPLPPGTPIISGPLVAGQRLTVDEGGWPSGTAFRYQWFIDGVAVKKATKSSWTVTPAAIGTRVSVQVTGSKRNYVSTPVLAFASETATIAEFSSAPAPVIAALANPKVGSTLTAIPGAAVPAATYRYQWRINGWAVPGATGRTWRIPPAARGLSVDVEVTTVRAGHVSVKQVSTTSVVVAA